MNISKSFKYVVLTLALFVTFNPAWSETRHTVKRGETIFGIAHRYQVSPEAILELNPQAANGVKKNMVLIIPDAIQQESIPDSSTPADPVIAQTPTPDPTPQPQNVVSAATTPSQPVTPSTGADKTTNVPTTTRTLISYISQPGDTFQSISRKTGVSEDDLIEFNPFVDPIRIPAGTQIRLSDSAPLSIYPEGYTYNPQGSQPTTEEPDSVQSEPQEEEEMLVDIEDNHRNIMLMLPFMAESSPQSKTAKQYADFYKGFLIAANQFNNSGTYDVEVITLDTENDPSKVRAQLANTADRNISVIIAPDDEAQLKEIIDYATPQGVYVLNIFNFKNEEYKNNPYVLQGNINQSLMYDKAIQALTSNFEDFVPVILSPTDAKEEKAPFIAAVKEYYIANGVEPIEIVFDDALTEEDLDVLDAETKYVFLYKSGSQSVFNRAALTLLNLITQDGYNGRFGVFGYPDWTMFRNASLSHLHQLGAVIYSRYDFSGDSAETKNLQDKFNHWYGTPMLESFPSQGTLGYDVGAYLLSALQQGSMTEQLENGEKHNQKYQGVQSTFNFSHDSNAKGYINNALYIITYRPDGSYSVKVL